MSEPFSFDPELLREMIDTVHMGECVTFPNGYVVDKRIYYASPAAPTIINQGWQ